MRFILALALLMATTSAAIAATPTANLPGSRNIGDDAMVRADVKKLVALMTDGVAEEAGEPIIAYAPPGSPDAGAAVVLFTMESWDGGNASIDFLAVFERTDSSDWPPEWKPHPFHLAALRSPLADNQLEVIGRKLTVDKDGVITIQGLTWGPDDPHCCPKKPVTIEFKDEGFELIQIH